MKRIVFERKAAVEDIVRAVDTMEQAGPVKPLDYIVQHAVSVGSLSHEDFAEIEEGYIKGAKVDFQADLLAKLKEQAEGSQPPAPTPLPPPVEPLVDAATEITLAAYNESVKHLKRIAKVCRAIQASTLLSAADKLAYVRLIKRDSYVVLLNEVIHIELNLMAELGLIATAAQPAEGDQPTA